MTSPSRRTRWRGKRRAREHTPIVPSDGDVAALRVARDKPLPEETEPPEVGRLMAHEPAKTRSSGLETRASAAQALPGLGDPETMPRTPHADDALDAQADRGERQGGGADPLGLIELDDEDCLDADEAPTRECVDDEDLRHVIQQGIRFSQSAAVMRHVAGCAYCQQEYREINRLLALGAENRLRESIAAGPDKIFAIIRNSARGERRRGMARRIGSAVGYGVLLVAAGATAALLASHTFQRSDLPVPVRTLAPGQLTVSPAVENALSQKAGAVTSPAPSGGRRSVTPGIAVRAIGPDGTTVLSTQPVLTATAPTKAPLTFVVELRRGNRWLPTLRGQSASHSFKVPTPLTRGSAYRWFAQAANGQRSSAGRFMVLDAASAAAVEAARAEDAASSLRMALVYTYYGLADDAIRAAEHPGLDPTAARTVVAFVRQHFHHAPAEAPPPAGGGIPDNPAPQNQPAPPVGQPTH